MKFLLSTILALAAAPFAHAASPSCPAGSACLPSNMQVQVYGVRMVPKPADYDLIRNAIGALVANVSLKKYVLQETGIEGGFTACLVPNGEQGYSAMMQKMTSIQVDKGETIYNVKYVEECGDR